MITLYFDNLRLFIPQYLASTVIAVFIYFYLGQKFPGKENTIPRFGKTRKMVNSPFFTPKNFRMDVAGTEFLLWPNKLSDSLKTLWKPDRVFFDPLSYFMENGFPPEVYRRFSSRYVKPSLFEENIVYQLYKIMFAVSAWAGLMLVITPFSYIYVFIPHFADPYNIIVAIILSISIFEGLVATIFFRVGVSFGRIALIEGLVITAFTLSLLSPSMSWLGNFNLQGKMIIYLILLLLFAAITGLISQLRTKRNLFLSSMIFSVISYFSFVVIVLYNVLNIVGI